MDLYRITKTDPAYPHKSYKRIGNKTRAWAIKREVDDINRGRQRLNQDRPEPYPMVTLKVEHVPVPDDWKDVTEQFVKSLPVQLRPDASPPGLFCASKELVLRTREVKEMTLTEVLANCKTNAPKGFALLNEKGPEGWLGSVGLVGLNMASPSACVLGYVYGGFYFGMRELFGLDDDTTSVEEWNATAEAYGFDTAGGAQRPALIAELGEEWRAIITAARAEQAPPA
jgi:hypothetical protein